MLIALPAQAKIAFCAICSVFSWTVTNFKLSYSTVYDSQHVYMLSRSINTALEIGDPKYPNSSR